MAKQPTDPRNAPAPRRDQARADRLKAALKANIARRKAQAKARKGSEEDKV